MDEKWTVQNDMENLSYYFDQLMTGWSIKAFFSGTFITCFSFFNADIVLYYIFLAAFFSDFILDICIGFKKDGCLSVEKVYKGIMKFVALSIYLVITGVAGVVLHKMGIPEYLFGLKIGLIDFFVSYLIFSEIFSIIRNMEILGFKTPPLLKMIVVKTQKKMESTIEGEKDGNKDSTNRNIG